MTTTSSKKDHIDWVRNSQRLLDSLNIAYILSDLDNVILEVNETQINVSGRSREELIGMRLEEFYDESDLERLLPFEKRLGKIEDVDESYQYEFSMINEDGEFWAFLASISPNLDENGKPLTFNTLVSNITELKKAQSDLENEKKLLETVLFGIGDCVTVFSASGEMLVENPKGKTIRGNRKHPLLDLVPGNQKALDIKTGKDIRNYDARIEAVHDDNGDVFAYVEMLTDTTDRQVLEKQTQELNRIRRSIKRREIESDMIGKSSAMNNVFDLILRCAEVDSNILILGETGVGKEVAARSVHRLSSRKNQPFVAVNCGALPDSLLESELFGHVKGAFTGAISDRPGLFREASGGTLFLDEIGDISPQMQVKLLRVLQEKEVRPLGDNQKYGVDVRVITATNKDLSQMMQQERFRTDLYYRIAVIPIIIPPLRERNEDILPLARHFMEIYQKKSDGRSRNISHKAQEALMRYAWPGNIRELENAIEYALAMSKSETLRSTDFPFQILPGNQSSQADDKPEVKEIVYPVLTENTKKIEPAEKTPFLRLSSPTPEEEKKAILSALKHYYGNRNLTARSLGVSRATLWNKMKKHDLVGWKYNQENI